MKLIGINTITGLVRPLAVLLIPVLFFVASHSYARSANQSTVDQHIRNYDQQLKLNHRATVKSGAIVAYQLARAGEQISLQEAVKRAKRRFPGKVLAAKRSINRQGQTVYRIKIISNRSEIRTITIVANQ